jgi:ABC-2 type transport system ATP-binding protein
VEPTARLSVDPIVELRCIRAGYGKTTVLDDVSMRIVDGVTAVVGANGGGKSTLLKVMATLIAPSAGSVLVCGRDVGTARPRAAARRGVGYLEQRARFPADLSVGTCLRYSAWLFRVPVSERAQAFADAVREFDIAGVVDDSLGVLSGGTHQRVMLAAASIHRPRLLLLDEPTAGVDPGRRAGIQQMLRAMADSRAVVITTHHIDDIVAFADRIIVITAGRVMFDGSLEMLEHIGTGPGVERARAVQVALPVLAIILVLHFAMRDHGWRREWMWAFDLLAFSVMLTGPVVAGLAAWEGARWASTRSLVAVGQRAGAAIAQYLGAMIAWVVALYLVAIGVLAVVVISGPVDAWPSTAVFGTVPPLLALLSAEIAAGFLVGWWLQRSFVAPLLAVGVFAASVLLYGIEPGLFVELGGATSSLLGLAPKRSVQLMEVVFYAAFTVTLVLAAALVADRTRPRLRVALVLLAAGTSVSAVGVVALGTTRFVEIAVDVECDGVRPEICLADGYRDLRPRLEATLGPAMRAVEAAGVDVPQRATQASADDRVLSLPARADLTDVDIVAMVVGAVIAPDCDIFANRSLFQAYLDVEYWVGDAIGDRDADPTVTPELTAGDSVEARVIVAARVETLQTCAT